jgi:hypothetical protein
VGLQLALGTWDSYWRHTPLGWAVTVAVVGSLVSCAVLVGRDPTTLPTHQAPRLWAVGPFLALGAMMLANPAFAASQSGTPLALAGPVHGLGLLLASWTVTRPRRPAVTAARGASRTRAVALVLFVAGALGLAGPGAFNGFLVLLGLAGAQVTAASMLSTALEPGAGTSPAGPAGAEPAAVPLRVAASACLVGLGTVLPLLVYQVAYDLPLGFSNQLVPVATAAALSMAGLCRPSAAVCPGSCLSRPAGRTLFAASGALVLAGTVVADSAWVATSRTGVRQEPGDGSGVVVSWNVHYGVSAAGTVDPEAIASTIEAQDPDAVLLQEVSRGWVMGGGVDMAPGCRTGWADSSHSLRRRTASSVT